MPDTFSHYGPVGVLILIGLSFGVGTLILTTLIGPHREGDIKGMTYEAGMNPIGSARHRFNVRFYMMAMTFLVFDVEIIFLYPWANVFPNLGQDSPLGPLFLGRMLFFVFTTVIAYLYAWRKGVFQFD